MFGCVCWVAVYTICLGYGAQVMLGPGTRILAGMAAPTYNDGRETMYGVAVAAFGA